MRCRLDVNSTEEIVALYVGMSNILIPDFEVLFCSYGD